MKVATSLPSATNLTTDPFTTIQYPTTFIYLFIFALKWFWISDVLLLLCVVSLSALKGTFK